MILHLSCILHFLKCYKLKASILLFNYSKIRDYFISWNASFGKK